MTDADYAAKVIELVNSFAYELCEECGHDLNAHAISPDPLGNPHAWCLTQPDPLRVARAQWQTAGSATTPAERNEQRAVILARLLDITE